MEQKFRINSKDFKLVDGRTTQSLATKVNRTYYRLNMILLSRMANGYEKYMNKVNCHEI